MEYMSHEMFEKERYMRAINRWGECGTVIGWSQPIKLPCPIGDVTQVGGFWLFKKDKDGSVSGTHHKSITFCKDCPKNCPKH